MSCLACLQKPCWCILRDLFAHKVGLLRTLEGFAGSADRETRRVIVEDLIDQYERTEECNAYWLGVLVPTVTDKDALARFIVSGVDDFDESSRLIMTWEFGQAMAFACSAGGMA